MQFESFGQLPSGETVRRYTLANDAGTAVQVITYGAIITSLRVPDHQGQLTDVVLGFDHLADYLAPHPYFGAIAGRVAGRITAGRFELEGRTHALNINNPPNHLHGGPIGFDRHLWQAKPVSRPDRAPSLRLETTSPDGDQGYPGNVTVAVTYTLTANHMLIVDSEATTDQSTPFNLTQHTYFNLRGEHSGSAVDHLLEIPATTYAPMDQDSTLLGRREPVIPGGNDFTAPRPLTQAIPLLNLHHGDLYFLREPRPATAPRELLFAARLHDPKSGRILTVQTDDDCLQFYTGVSLDSSQVGKSGHAYHAHAGLCLECEGYPDAVNQPHLGDIILRPNQIHRRSTHYAFSAQTPA